jgi:hypothetical protein
MPLKLGTDILNCSQPKLFLTAFEKNAAPVYNKYHRGEKQKWTAG